MFGNKFQMNCSHLHEDLELDVPGFIEESLLVEFLIFFFETMFYFLGSSWVGLLGIVSWTLWIQNCGDSRFCSFSSD